VERKEEIEEHIGRVVERRGDKIKEVGWFGKLLKNNLIILIHPTQPSIRFLIFSSSISVYLF